MRDDERRQSAPPPAADGPARDGGERPFPRRLYPSRLLFEGAQEVLILHDGQEYRLRITRAGKLILTK